MKHSQLNQLDTTTIHHEELSSDYIKHLIITSNTESFFDLCKLTNYSPLLYNLLDFNLNELETNKEEYNLTDETDLYNVIYTYTIYRQHLLETHMHRCLSEADAHLFMLLNTSSAFDFLNQDSSRVLLQDTWALVELEMDTHFLDNVSHYADCKTLYKYASTILNRRFGSKSIAELSEVEWISLNN